MPLAFRGKSARIKRRSLLPARSIEEIVAKRLLEGGLLAVFGGGLLGRGLGLVALVGGGEEILSTAPRPPLGSKTKPPKRL